MLRGARSDDVRLTLLDGAGEEIVFTTGYADAEHDGALRVRIDQLHGGILWLPERMVTFAPPAGGVPVRTPENAAELAAAFWADLGR